MNITAKRRLRYLSAFAALLLIEVLIALFVHDAFVRPFIGDVLVVAVLYCLVRIIKPDGWRFLPVVLFLFATGVEFLQALGFVPLLGGELPVLGGPYWARPSIPPTSYAMRPVPRW